MVGRPSNTCIVARRDICATIRPARIEPGFGAQLNLVDRFVAGALPRPGHAHGTIDIAVRWPV
jgi:hypothetical protein